MGRGVSAGVPCGIVIIYFDVYVLLKSDLTFPVVSFVRAFPDLYVSVYRTMYCFLGEGARRRCGLCLLVTLSSFLLSTANLCGTEQCLSGKWAGHSEEGVCYGSAVPTVPLTYREMGLWIMWESLCDAFYFLLFLVFFSCCCLFCFMLRTNLMAHCCRCFTEGMR